MGCGFGGRGWNVEGQALDARRGRLLVIMEDDETFDAGSAAAF